MGDLYKKHADMCMYPSPKWRPLVVGRSLAPIHICMLNVPALQLCSWRCDHYNHQDAASMQECAEQDCPALVLIARWPSYT